MVEARLRKEITITERQYGLWQEKKLKMSVLKVLMEKYSEGLCGPGESL